jgi:pimeloyl-ACP methyl ester carboxylesterase
MRMRIRQYGNKKESVVVLHGGPAATGDVAAVAQGLSDRFTAIEPWQRGSGNEPLTVARHVEDLHDLIKGMDPPVPPALVGHSWGAMLALCYAAAHPNLAGPIVLVGCGTFDRASRDRKREILWQRTDRRLQEQLAELDASGSDTPELHMKRLRLTRDLSVYERIEPWPEKEEYEPLDVRAHEETWSDMMRLQADGTYPGAFTAIRSDVLMLHGNHDPHPGPLIYASLRPFIDTLEYRELDRCGHSPWVERFARAEFFAMLTAWLLARRSRT